MLTLNDIQYTTKLHPPHGPYAGKKLRVMKTKKKLKNHNLILIPNDLTPYRAYRARTAVKDGQAFQFWTYDKILVKTSNKAAPRRVITGSDFSDQQEEAGLGH